MRKHATTAKITPAASDRLEPMPLSGTGLIYWLDMIAAMPSCVTK